MNDFVHNLTARIPDGLRVALLAGLGFSVVATLFPRVARRVFGTIEPFFSRFAGRKILAIVILFFTVIVVRLAVLRQLPVPVPGIHDEYSYLLAGETPAQGFAIALGDLLGHPWIAAILWMLQGWLPGRWAFLGGGLVALKFGVASERYSRIAQPGLGTLQFAAPFGFPERLPKHLHKKESHNPQTV